MSSTTDAPKPLTVVCFAEMVQVSDIMGIDIIGNLSAEYVKELASWFPQFQQYVAQAPEMKFYFPATTTDKPMRVTPGMYIQANVTYEDCPRDADILLIGGPPPQHRPEESLRYLREAFPKTETVLTTCVGALWLAASGVLAGKKATTNRGALGMAKQMHPETEWLDQRWVVEDGGKLWTSGGAGAGIDMVSVWCIEKFGKEFTFKMSLEGLDLDPHARGQFYSTPNEGGWTAASA